MLRLKRKQPLNRILSQKGRERRTDEIFPYGEFVDPGASNAVLV